MLFFLSTKGSVKNKNHWFPSGNWAWVWQQLLVIHTCLTPFPQAWGWLWGPLFFTRRKEERSQIFSVFPKLAEVGPPFREIDAKMPSPLADPSRAHRVPSGHSGNSPANVRVAQKSAGPTAPPLESPLSNFNSKQICPSLAPEKRARKISISNSWYYY